jgi:pterin-4a-carbinolamine dehydratase
MSDLRRVGNFGVVNTGKELVSFSIGAAFSGFEGAANFNFTIPNSWQDERVQVGNYQIIPLGSNNDMPLELQRMLDEFYSGEGILGKIQGLQWGEGPRLYTELETDDGDLTRKWKNDREVMAWLKSWNHEDFLLRSHTDLIHGFGYFYKIFRNRGTRIGAAPKIASLEHVSVDKCRLEYPGIDGDYPKRIIVGHFPNVRIDKLSAYPIWNKQQPFALGVSMGYQSVYSFCKAFYSTPRFLGAYSWIMLASNIAPLLTAYNANASAISFHIESPQSYWDKAAEKLRNNCMLKGIEYTDKLLETFKDDTFKNFTEALTGTQNVGKFLHTTEFFDDLSNDYHGWKVTPLDKKIKDYIDAQIAIADKADSAATSGFGLHPSLSNIMVGGKMSSGSEMLYALKGYLATEVAIPEMILFAPINAAIEANFPDKNLKMGFYRKVVMKESEVNPEARVKENV